MKRPFHFPIARPSAFRLPPSAFTLVEMLVVITIIGILASLITAAAIVARRSAKNAAVSMEVRQLEMACQAYKEKFGEYPPDFATVNWQYIRRHLAKAFPRFTPGLPPYNISGTNQFLTSVCNAWGLPAGTLTPVASKSLVFWLGGKPKLDPSTNEVVGFLGFSADPSNPFDLAGANSVSRIKPFYDFDPNRMYQYKYWPAEAIGSNKPDGNTRGPIVYFKSENTGYLVNGFAKSYSDVGTTVRPAADTRLTSDITDAAKCTWINPQSFQIFTSGLDMTYGPLVPVASKALAFPSGANYAPETYDDITNFSGGTLEDAIP